MLLLKKHLVELVRSGKKRQTIRLWTRSMLRAGQISYTPGLGRMKILTVDQLDTLAALSEADAVADGFGSLASLLAEIQRIYGDAPVGRKIYRIRFEWPIDEAGEKLVIAKPAVTKRPAPARKAQSRVPRLATSSMTASQRRAVRSFVIAHRPRS